MLREEFYINGAEFNFKNAKEVYIYGASYIGSVTGKALLKKGMSLRGFIDKRAEDIKECIGLPVYDMEGLKSVASTQAVIFVAVKNVYYHMEIAKTLYVNGYTRIIYKTAHAINGGMDCRDRVLDEAYESIYKTGDIPEFDIPIVEPKKEFGWNSSKILKEEKEFIIFYAPMEQIYTGLTAKQWTNIPILALLPHIRLFQYFEGTLDKRPDDYIRECEKGARSESIAITESWKDYILQNRFHTYEQMRWRYDNAPEFFIEQAPEVVWNEKGYFNLQTGKHRICFLAAMGKTSVPVKLKRDTWERLNEDVNLNKIRQILERNPEAKLPLPHFYFQGNRQYHCIFYQKKLRKILEQMYDNGLMRGNDKKFSAIYDFTKNRGYFAFLFSQMGFHIYRNSKISLETEIYRRMGMNVFDVPEISEAKAVVLAEQPKDLDSRISNREGYDALIFIDD